MKKLLSLALLVLTTSCASYKAQTLPNLSLQTAPFSQEKEGVEVSCKVFTREDCMRYLDRDVITQGFQPIQITIDNKTTHSLSFSKNAISIVTADPAYVANEVHTSTVARATSYGVGAMLVWPFTWPLAIPAIVDGVKSSHANELLDKDFSQKSPGDQSIPPHGYLNGVIFVPNEHYQESFTLALVDTETLQPITFTLQARRP